MVETKNNTRQLGYCNRLERLHRLEESLRYYIASYRVVNVCNWHLRVPTGIKETYRVMSSRMARVAASGYELQLSISSVAGYLSDVWRNELFLLVVVLVKSSK